MMILPRLQCVWREVERWTEAVLNKKTKRAYSSWFDIGFESFNRPFDIDEKPSPSIGLVAGALVAIAYWAAVILGWFVHHA